MNKFCHSLLLVLYFTFQLNSQTNTISTYSAYGGQDNVEPNSKYSAMGGTDLSFVEYNSFNSLNPASYARTIFSTLLFQVNTNAIKFKTNKSNSNQSITYVSQFAIGVPIKSSAIALGIKPFNSVGYSIKYIGSNENGKQLFLYDAKGGLNSVYFGVSFMFLKDFSAGINVNYLFGTEEKVNSVIQENVQFGTQIKYSKMYEGKFNYDFGLQYSNLINNKSKLNVGVTYRPKINIPTKNNTEVFSGFIRGSELIDFSDTIVSILNVAGNSEIPSKFRIGIGLAEELQWGIGVQYELTMFKNINIDGINQGFDNSTRLGAGGYWIPKYNSFKSYFYRITYRFGSFYENTHIFINSQRIKNYGITFGLGIPIGKNKASSFNIALELGKKGTIKNNLLEENYLNLNLNFFLNDLWFRKRRYD